MKHAYDPSLLAASPWWHPDPGTSLVIQGGRRLVGTYPISGAKSAVLLLGALLVRCGEACLPMPGGDTIGLRGIDFHVAAQPGAEQHMRAVLHQRHEAQLRERALAAARARIAEAFAVLGRFGHIQAGPVQADQPPHPISSRSDPREECPAKLGLAPLVARVATGCTTCS